LSNAALESLTQTPVRAALDGVLEPSDQTIAELQAMVVQSRKLNAEGQPLGYADLVMAISENLRRMCEHPDPHHAIAIAALALRIREEHLV
jgi:hypothetical protein